jgi:hypothetical protein
MRDHADLIRTNQVQRKGTDSLQSSAFSLNVGAKAVFIGLVMTQAIATLHVYVSNAGLYGQMRLIIAAGYRAVPNQHILPQLTNFGTAFCGAVFFTLTIGCFLSLISFSFAWCYSRVFHRSRWMMGSAVGVWLFLLWGVNVKGFAPFESAYVLFVMPGVFALSVKLIPETDIGPGLGRMIFLHWIPLILLAILWTSQPDQRMFSDFRDAMLLSNGPGLKINDFYYAYTLYPAEVFKPLDQKVLKTVYLDNIEDAKLVRGLKNVLMADDYLPLDQKKAVDLIVSMEKGRLVLKHKNRTVFDVSAADFLNSPWKMLKTFSKQIDGSAFFRRLTFFSLLLGLPVCLYLFLWSVIHYVLSRFIGSNAASALSAALCFLAGLSLLIPFYVSRRAHVEKPDIPRLMASADSRDRVSALKAIYEAKLEIGDYPSYRQMCKSPYILERYWLAMTLRNSTRPDTLTDLMKMADDPHPNVVCKAFYALGRRGDPSTIVFLLEKLNASNHWYAQVYAYGALRELGWQQTGLN